ncbi:MAG: O-antigen ligase family protein [Hyphomicrobiales bacterium]|nr:O-antigen ligase family protein [Hyphomicrobiales bacterium]
MRKLQFEDGVSLATYPVHRRTDQTEKLLRVTLGLMLALSCVSFIEPSPYEFLFFVLIPVSLLNGLAVTRTTMTLFFILFAIVVAQFFALIPYIQYRVVGDGLTPSLYTIYTVYLYSSAVLFALIFSHDTDARVTLALKTYAFSCVFAGAWGILSFVNFMGLNEREPIDGRIAGPFKDPNVLGSYCIMGVLYLTQSMLLSRRHTPIKLAGMLVAFIGGTFFSMSRGSLGAMMFGFLFLLTTTWFTGDRRVRRRIVSGLTLMVVLGGLGAAIIATSSDMVANITMRAKIEQEYDGGVTGRFGNQKRSIPMLLSAPFGLGPFRFPVYFQLQPHNSYIGAFSDAGWLGGLSFLIMALSTSFLGVRLALKRSPFMRHAQVVTPAALGFFLQALQIDIDHWRFVFLMIGMIWGMESARRAIRARQSTPQAPAL